MPEPVFLDVELKLVPAEVGTFLAVMDEVAPLMQQDGWSLVGAWRIRIGRAHTVRVVWQLPDANAYLGDRPAFSGHPRFAQFAKVIAAAVLEETVSVMTPVSYGRAA